MHSELLTKDKLQRRGIQTDMLCVFCSNVNETLGHLFFECVALRNTWKKLMVNIGRFNSSSSTANEWNNLKNQTGSRRIKGRILNYVLKKYVSAMWRERNVNLFNSSNVTPHGH